MQFVIQCLETQRLIQVAMYFQNYDTCFMKLHLPSPPHKTQSVNQVLWGWTRRAWPWDPHNPKATERAVPSLDIQVSEQKGH